MDAFDHQPNLNSFFASSLSEALHAKIGLPMVPEVETYLVNMMTTFLREDHLFSLRDGSGKPLTRICDMLEYGDVRLRATSFDQERVVHRHIGNLLLFCSGFFPEYLPRLGVEPVGRIQQTSSWFDPTLRGAESYRLASQFDYDPYGLEAKVLNTLSHRFADYQYGLSLVRDRMNGSAWGQKN